jgi:hypothetical protein
MRAKNGLDLRMEHTARIVPGLVLAVLFHTMAFAAPQQGQNQAPTPSAQEDNAPVPPMPPLDPADSAEPSADLLPDSPGAVLSAQLGPQQEGQQQPAQPLQAQPLAAQQPQPAPPREPLGAAAAETVPTMGVAASRPSGAAVAPAKQRRIRTILIRTGAVIGAAAAVGVTMALTEGSPSKPPGAH